MCFRIVLLFIKYLFQHFKKKHIKTPSINFNLFNFQLLIRLFRLKILKKCKVKIFKFFINYFNHTENGRFVFSQIRTILMLTINLKHYKF